MTNNQRQVPDALRLAEEITNLECSSEAVAKTIAAAADELCRLHVENEALRTQPQAGAVPQGWKAVPVNPTPEMWKAAKTVPDPNPPYPPHYGLVWDAMLAASPTPPAEQGWEKRHEPPRPHAPRQASAHRLR